MGHSGSIGDWISAMALAAIILGYFISNRATDSAGLKPLPELPIDPPLVDKRPDPHAPLILGIVLLAFGAGSAPPHYVI